MRSVAGAAAWLWTAVGVRRVSQGDALASRMQARRSLSAVQFPSAALPELLMSLDRGVATSVTSCAGADACNDDVCCWASACSLLDVAVSIVLCACW